MKIELAYLAVGMGIGLVTATIVSVIPASVYHSIGFTLIEKAIRATCLVEIKAKNLYDKLFPAKLVSNEECENKDKVHLQTYSLAPEIDTHTDSVFGSKENPPNLYDHDNDDIDIIVCKSFDPTTSKWLSVVLNQPLFKHQAFPENFKASTFSFITFDVNVGNETYKLFEKTHDHNFLIFGNVIDKQFIYYYLKHILNVQDLPSFTDFIYDIFIVDSNADVHMVSHHGSIFIGIKEHNIIDKIPQKDQEQPIQTTNDE